MFYSIEGIDRNETVFRGRKTLAFTLTELLTVLSLIALLLAILLPSVQAVRESSRKLQCQNNLHQVGFALSQFESTNGRLPAGDDRFNGTEVAWSTRLLPFVEQSSIYAQLDLKSHWTTAGSNERLSRIRINVYECPSTRVQFDGKQDYGGIIGTGLLPLPFGLGPRDGFGCGSLIMTSREQIKGIRFSEVTDGLSQTLSVGESVDRESTSSGRWASGRNCFSQNEKHVSSRVGELYSLHPSGCNALLLDGSVHFLQRGIESDTLGRLCSRNDGEAVSAL